MKQYSIPVVWQSMKRYNVDADNLQDAVAKALIQFLEEPDYFCIEDSFEIDGEGLEDYEGETYSMEDALDNYYKYKINS